MKKVAIIVVTDGNDILTIRRSKRSNKSGQWESPVGHIEDDETPFQAALRETEEETGLRVLLFPQTVKISLQEGGVGYIFRGAVPGLSKRDKQITLNPDEHDAFEWVTLDRLGEKKPTPPDFEKNVRKILNMTSIEDKNMTGGKSIRKAAALSRVQVLPESVDLKEAVLVGDEVDIFLKGQIDGPSREKPSLSGVVEQRSKNCIWIRDPDRPFEKPRLVPWNNKDSWAFIRVIRGKDSVYYVNGNPRDPDGKVIQRAKGLGLILESRKPKRTESVFRIMRGETPDLDFSVGQAPKDLGVVAPSNVKNRILTQVREILQENSLEPDMVDDVGSGRVMILTQDSDLKSQIRSILRKKGVSVTSTRTALIVTERKAINQQTLGETPAMNFKVTLPKPEDAVKQLEKDAGVPVKKTPSGMEVDFQDPFQMEQFLQKNKDMSEVGRRGSTRRKVRVGEIAAALKRSLRSGNFNVSGKCLGSLLKLGVEVSSLARARLANKHQWTELERFLESQGNIESSRVTRKLASMSVVP